MKITYFLSIDIGTSSTKLVLMDWQGECLATVSREYPTIYEENGGVVQDAQDWWDAIIYGCKQLAERFPKEMYAVEAISVDGQSSTVLPIDTEGKLLSKAMIWTDHRAIEQERCLLDEVGQSLFTEINGNHINASNIACKIMWLKKNRKACYEKTWKFLTSTGFAVYKLTGQAICDVTEGGLSQLMDMRRLEWSDALIKACDIDRDKLPELRKCFEVAGTLRKEIAQNLGLAEAVKVLTGAMDACACALGTGVDRDSNAFITGGTVTAIGVGTKRPIMNGKLHVYPHIVPGIWLSVAGVDFGGGNYRWFRDQFMQDLAKDSVYEIMNKMAAESRPGAHKLLFLPSLVGQRCPQWDLDMRGAFVGISSRHTKSDFLRAIMEGNAFGIREIMELQEQAGADIHTIMIAGGIAKSDLWMQIFSQVLHKTIWKVYSQQDTAYGNLLNAAYGLGIYDSLSQKLPGRDMRAVDVPEQTTQIYDQLYRIYKEVYPGLKQVFSTLAKIKDEEDDKK